MIQARVMQDKYEDSQNAVETAANVVIGWSLQNNGRLPNTAEFTAITGSKQDAWRQNLVYIYDADLANISTGGICGRNSTGISASGISDIAFVIISGGNDVTIDSTPNTSGDYTGTATLSENDLIRTITLNRLHAKMCFSQNDMNLLEVLNHELPEACEGEVYAAEIHAKGGVAPYSWSYSIKPTWLILTDNGNSYQCGGTPSAGGIYPTEIVLLDAAGKTIQKEFNIKVKPCPGP